LGMDAGLWEDVRASKSNSLGDAEREPFYQLLAALGQPKAADLHSAARQPLDLVSLLEKPSEHTGEIRSIEGVARRILKVAVSDADIQSRFGIDHYYQIDMFLPLGDASLRLGKAGDKNPIYQVTWGKDQQLKEFSKHFAHEQNPPKDFAAILVCDEADEACPTVPGASIRISAPYFDPKAYDGTSLETRKYAERRDDIGRMMLCALMQARRQIRANEKAE